MFLVVDNHNDFDSDEKHCLCISWGMKQDEASGFAGWHTSGHNYYTVFQTYSVFYDIAIST